MLGKSPRLGKRIPLAVQNSPSRGGAGLTGTWGEKPPASACSPLGASATPPAFKGEKGGRARGAVALAFVLLIRFSLEGGNRVGGHAEQQHHKQRRENPLSKFEMGKEERHKSPLTLEGLDLIIANAPEHLAWAIRVAWNLPCRPGLDLFSLTFSENVKWQRGGLRVFHRKVQKRVFVRCSGEFMQAQMERRRQHKSDYLIEYKGRSVADIGTAFSNAARRAGLEYAVCPYDIRHLWITTMLDKQVEISAIAHLAGTSVRMIIKTTTNLTPRRRKRRPRCCRSSEPRRRRRCGWLIVPGRFRWREGRSQTIVRKENRLARRFASPCLTVWTYFRRRNSTVYRLAFAALFPVLLFELEEFRLMCMQVLRHQAVRVAEFDASYMIHAQGFQTSSHAEGIKAGNCQLMRVHGMHKTTQSVLPAREVNLDDQIGILGLAKCREDDRSLANGRQAQAQRGRRLVRHEKGQPHLEPPSDINKDDVFQAHGAPAVRTPVAAVYLEPEFPIADAVHKATVDIVIILRVVVDAYNVAMPFCLS